MCLMHRSIANSLLAHHAAVSRVCLCDPSATFGGGSIAARRGAVSGEIVGEKFTEAFGVA